MIIQHAKYILSALSVFMLILLATPGSAQTAPFDFKVVITLDSIPPLEKIFLEYRGDKINPEEFDIDSITPLSNTVTFIGKIREPWTAALVIKYKQKHLSGRYKTERYDFFLSPANVQININKSLNNVRISGPGEMIDFSILQKQELSYKNRKDSLLDKLIDCEDLKNHACSTQIEEDLRILDKERREKIYISYYIKHPQSALAVYTLKEGMPAKIDETSRYESLFEMLPEKSKQKPSAIKLRSRITGTKNSSIGNQAINFTQPDTSGNPITLSSFIGKYLLLDFWASWCIPCRRQHPALVEIYKKHKGVNFEILSVALEQKNDTNKWIEAIKKDQLIWYHVSDFGFWNNKAAELYGVGSLPSNFLVNPNGIIIAKDLEPGELDEILSTLTVTQKK